jgi:hypothetical protein
MHARLSDEEYFAEMGALGPNGVWIGGSAFFTREELADFRLVIVPLEARTGKPLNGPGLRKCQRAYRENATAFRRLADEALSRANRNPLGLLIRMVSDRDHFLEDPPTRPVELSASKDLEARPCSHDTCAAEGGDHCLYDASADPALEDVLRNIEAA